MGFAFISHYIINIYILIHTTCPVWFWWFLRGCSAVHRWGLVVWCCPDCFALLWLVRCCRWVGWLSVRLAIVVAVAGLFWCVLCPLSAFVLTVSLALAVLGRSFAVPCRVRWWGGVFACPLLFVACSGVCRLCLAVALAFGLWGLPRPYFGASEWGSDYPLKISEKNFSRCGVCVNWGFPRNIIY